MSLEVTYRGYLIRWSDNDDCWTCFDFARPKSSTSLNSLKRAIDKLDRDERKAAAIEAMKIDIYGAKQVTVVEYLGVDRYSHKDSVAIMGDSNSSREKSRTTCDISHLAPITPETEQPIAEYLKALDALKQAQAVVLEAKNRIPRLTTADIAKLVKIHESEGGDA